MQYDDSKDYRGLRNADVVFKFRVDFNMYVLVKPVWIFTAVGNLKVKAFI